MAEHQITDDTNNFRSTAAQVLCSVAFNSLAVNVGLIYGMLTIVIGALRQEDSLIALSESEASWVGSLIFIVQPFGCMSSGFLQDWFGRKICLILNNIAQLIAWACIYFCSSVTYLYLAVALMGVSVGCLEAPILAYIGETTQPRLRGIIFGFVAISFNVGLALETLLGSLMPWRTMVLWSMAGPVISFIAMIFVPETPVWLVSKGRIRDAEKSVRWLRGWVSPEAVKGEMAVLVSYVKNTSTVKMLDNVEYKAVPGVEGGTVHEEPNKGRWRVLLDYDVLIAFRIVFLYFCTSNCASLLAIRPFMLDILGGMNPPISAHLVVTICGAMTMLGALTMSLCIKPMGKRVLTFLSMGLSVVSCLGIGFYMWLGLDFPWVPVILFPLSFYSSSAGIINIPWILIVELIPLRARSMGVGICGSVGYILLFLVSKTYYTLTSWMDVAGAFIFYGTAGLLGIIHLYFDMPETEGVSLEEVERQLRARKSKNNTQRKLSGIGNGESRILKV